VSVASGRVVVVVVVRSAASHRRQPSCVRGTMSAAPADVTWGAVARRFLGYVDYLGTAFEDNYAATGYGLAMALPLIRDR